MFKTDFCITAYKLLNENNCSIEEHCKELRGQIKNDDGKMAEYKCEKFRLASLQSVERLVLHGSRVIELGKIHIEIEDNLKSDSSYADLYKASCEAERNDSKLYYGIKISIESKLKAIEEKMPVANDWERIELECRKEGLIKADGFLDTAWNNRKAVAK